MKLYYCKRCYSTRLYRDTCVGINNPDEVSIYDHTECADCGYDGSTYMEVELPETETLECIEGGEIPEQHRLLVSSMAQEIYL